MIEKGVRGGVSMISKRHGKANNKYMKRGSTTEGRLGEEYDPSQPSKYITYLDANNLYGWAMSKPLPISNFKWMKNLNNWRNRLMYTGGRFGISRRSYTIYTMNTQ